MRAASAPARSLAEHAHAHASKSCWPELDAQTAREFEPFARNGGVTGKISTRRWSASSRISARDHPQDIMRVLVVNGTLHVYQADLVAPATGLPHGWVSSNEGRPHPMVLALLKVHLESAKPACPISTLCSTAAIVLSASRTSIVLSRCGRLRRIRSATMTLVAVLVDAVARTQQGAGCVPWTSLWSRRGRLGREGATARLAWVPDERRAELAGRSKPQLPHERGSGRRVEVGAALAAGLKCGQLASCDAGFHHWPPRHFSPQVQDEMERETGGYARPSTAPRC